MKEFLGFRKGHPVRKLWEQLVNSNMYGAFYEGHVDEVLHDGDKFALGNITLQMLYTPGHLPDHMCIEILEPNIVYGSDIDLTEFGPYYGHPNSSISEFKESIHKLQHNNYKALISGHLKEPIIEDYKTALAAYQRQFGIRFNGLSAEPEEREKLWGKVGKRAKALYGEGISLPSAEHFSGKTPVEFIDNLQNWLEGDAGSEIKQEKEKI